MKWYDYTFIFFIADFATGALFAGNIFALTSILLLYSIYEDYRKGDSDDIEE